MSGSSNTYGEPKDKAGFGYVLWLVIGGKDANKAVAAQRLGIARPSLSNVIHGTKRISQQALTQKRWREILAKHYPDNWRKYSADFERYAASMPRKAHLSPEPKDKTSFGHILWHILGGEEARFAEAARRLKIDPSSLTDICQGRRKISQKGLADKKWEKILAAHYADNWPRHSAAFHSFIAKLPKSSTGFATREPSNKASFAHVLWLILGGKNIGAAAATRRLKTDATQLSAIFCGLRRLSRKTLARKQWRKVLAKHYPDAWNRHAAAFERHTAMLPASAGVSTREPKDPGSFGHVLWLILGGKDTELSVSASRLGISARKLSAIIHGGEIPSQGMLASKSWSKVLAAHFPDTWREHGDRYDQCAAALPRASENSRSRARR
jgi:plasmid maintenance system antidote protein VapI